MKTEFGNRPPWICVCAREEIEALERAAGDHQVGAGQRDEIRTNRATADVHIERELRKFAATEPPRKWTMLPPPATNSLGNVPCPSTSNVWPAPTADGPLSPMTC